MVLTLSGCAVVEVSPQQRRAAERFVERERLPLPTTHIAVWYSANEAVDLVCGEIEAPDAAKPEHATLRYVHDATRDDGQIELHGAWRTRGVVSQSLLENNRMIFDNLWQRHCQPHAPLRRRIARWFD